MRVSTRIISGFAILVLLGLVALAYQVWFIHRMQTINADLSAINFQAAAVVLRLGHDAEVIHEFSKKYFVNPDFYAASLDEVVNEFDAELSSLQQLVSSQDSRSDVNRLTEAWNEYKEELEVRRLESADDFPPILEDKVERLRLRTSMAYDAVEKSIRGQVSRAAQIGENAERLSSWTGAAALVLGVSLTFVLVRAISDPLRQLTRSTRIIAKGQFWHRLPTDGHDEFAELARDFNAMSERLGELDRMKKDFVSHVSHELKAPLASIRQTCLLLLAQIPGPLNDQQLRLLRLSNGSAERLSSMVGNLLDVSRMETGTMEYEMVRNDLVGLASAVAEEFELQAKEKNVQIIVENDERDNEPIEVECDRDRIVQVIGNLFDNALKFSPRESQIVGRVRRVGLAPSERPRVVFSVTDRGPGVPSGHKDRVFAKFHQVKQGRKIAGQGVGLGLAICKTIIEAHQGRIWVEDNPSGGSVFCFELRAAATAEAAHANKMSTPA